MKYNFSRKWTEQMKEIVQTLEFTHINTDKVTCITSQGTKTRNTIARIHALPKAMQLGMNTEAFYVIELIAEQFNRQDSDEKIKTLIHELMHIPHSFGGGFRNHRQYVTKRHVDIMYGKYMKMTAQD